MCSTNSVQKNVRRALKNSKNGRITARSTEELKKQVGASSMGRLQFQELLARLKHQKEVRGFSLKAPAVYIQG